MKEKVRVIVWESRRVRKRVREKEWERELVGAGEIEIMRVRVKE